MQGASERENDVWGICDLIRARDFMFVDDEVWYTKDDFDCEFLAAK